MSSDQREEEVDNHPLVDVPCELGEFRVEKLLGEGGITCVYQATHRGDSRQVALKILKPGRLEDGTEQQHIDETGWGHLESEFRIASQLEHPNVLRMMAYHTQPQPHLELELFSPVTLHDFVTRDEEGENRIDELLPHFAQYVEQMAAALMHLHAAGFVHGDVKPGNFLVNEQHQVKLIDYSYIKPIYIDGKFRRPRLESGTPAYMPPEQKMRWPLDQRTDIYALGRTLYVLAVGQLPLAERRGMTMRQLAETPTTPDAHRVNPIVTQAFADLLMEMMEEVPVNRPASIAKVLEQFRGLQLFSA